MIFIQPSVLCRRTLVCQEPQNNLLILLHYGKMTNNNLIFILPPWMKPQFYFRTNHWEWKEPIIFNPLNAVPLIRGPKERGMSTLVCVWTKDLLYENLCMGGREIIEHSRSYEGKYLFSRCFMLCEYTR